MTTANEYTKLETPSGLVLHNCPVCASKVEVWQYIDKPGGPAEKLICCSHDSPIGPQESLAGEG